MHFQGSKEQLFTDYCMTEIYFTKNASPNIFLRAHKD